MPLDKNLIAKRISQELKKSLSRFVLKYSISQKINSIFLDSLELTVRTERNAIRKESKYKCLNHFGSRPEWFVG